MKTVKAHPVIIKLHNTLAEELERLKNLLGVGHELTVEWLPGQNEKLSGEVKGHCIYVYDKDEKSALETLKHEFLDYLISRVVEPYEKVANLMIRMVNDEGYARKEKLVEALSQLL